VAQPAAQLSDTQQDAGSNPARPTTPVCSVVVARRRETPEGQAQSLPGGPGGHTPATTPGRGVNSSVPVCHAGGAGAIPADLTTHSTIACSHRRSVHTVSIHWAQAHAGSIPALPTTGGWRKWYTQWKCPTAAATRTLWHQY
jgi:hypothetical protein